MRPTLRSLLRPLVLLLLLLAMGVGALFRAFIRWFVRPIVVAFVMLSLWLGNSLRALRQRRAYRLAGIEILPAERATRAIPEPPRPPKPPKPTRKQKPTAFDPPAPYVAPPDFVPLPPLEEALRVNVKSRWLTRRYVVFLVVFTVVCLIIAHNAPPPLQYQRYVSPPFSDGSHYTFLYPSGWQTPHFQMVANGDNGVAFWRRLNDWERFRRWVGLPAGPPEGNVTVYEAKIDPATVRPPRYEVDASYHDRLEHVVEITSAPLHRVIVLSHRGTVERGDDFGATDATITGSFKLIPPGGNP